MFLDQLDPILNEQLADTYYQQDQFADNDRDPEPQALVMAFIDAGYDDLPF